MRYARAIGYALAGGALAFLVANVRLQVPFGNTDSDQLWAAARVILDGGDPYAAIGPAGPIRFQYPFYYPLTAAILVLPLGLLSLEVFRGTFMALSGAVLGFALGRHRPWLWPLFLGFPFFIVARNGQWAALLAAVLVMPWLGAVTAAKPNIGVAILAGTGRLRSALIIGGGGLVVLLVSLAVDPTWPWKLREALSGAQHFSPLIARPGGFLILLALLRYRDPDARLLLGLALVPQTGMMYEVLPAGLVARTRAQAAFLALATHVAWHVGVAAYEFVPTTPFVTNSWNEGKVALWGGLMVPLAMVLGRGVDVGRLPLVRPARVQEPTGAGG